MKKLLKLAAVGLAAVLTAVSLSACGADTGAGTSAPASNGASRRGNETEPR